MTDPLVHIAVVAAADSRGYLVETRSHAEGTLQCAKVYEESPQTRINSDLGDRFGQADLMKAFTAIGLHHRHEFNLFPVYGEVTPAGGKSFTMAFAADLFLRDLRRPHDRNLVDVFQKAGHLSNEHNLQHFVWEKAAKGVVVCALGEIHEYEFTWGNRSPIETYGAKLKKVSSWLTTPGGRSKKVVYVVPKAGEPTSRQCLAPDSVLKVATTLPQLYATMAEIIKQST